MADHQDLLTGFFSAVESDHRITTVHISLYMALLHLRLLYGTANPVVVKRSKLLLLSKTSRTTYQKCIKELHEYGYIEYMPSFNRKGISSFQLLEAPASK